MFPMTQTPAVPVTAENETWALTVYKNGRCRRLVSECQQKFD